VKSSPGDAAPPGGPDPGPTPAHPAGPPKRSHDRRLRWSLAAAWKRAERVRQATNPVTLTEPDVRGQAVQLSSDPVTRAKELAAQFAVADMRLSLALSHGTDLDTLEALKAGSRFIAELAHKRLSILGLKSGEAVSLEPSERMAEFLERWHAAGGGSAAEPPEPEPDGERP
jgi:hypothetical protein